MKQVAVDLAGTLGGSAGDGAADTVTVNGTGGNDQINVTTSGTQVTVSGLPAQVTVDHAEDNAATQDHLVINAGAGNDTINASALPAGTIGLTLNGGASAATHSCSTSAATDRMWSRVSKPMGRTLEATWCHFWARRITPLIRRSPTVISRNREPMS